MKIYVKAKDFFDLYQKIAKIEHWLYFVMLVVVLFYLNCILGDYFLYFILFSSILYIVWLMMSSDGLYLDFVVDKAVASKLPCARFSEVHEGARKKVRNALDLMCNIGTELPEFLNNTKYLKHILLDMQNLESAIKQNVPEAKETYELLDSYLDDFIDSKKSYILGQLIEAGKRKYLKEDAIVKGIRSKYDLS